MDFEEEYLFAKYKDKGFNNSRSFKSKIRKTHKNIDVDSLYIRVIRYQIKKYGKILCGNGIYVPNQCMFIKFDI